MNPCVLFSGILHKPIFRMRAERIPPVYGIDSARIRNAFRRATEYCRNIENQEACLQATSSDVG